MESLSIAVRVPPKYVLVAAGCEQVVKTYTNVSLLFEAGVGHLLLNGMGDSSDSTLADIVRAGRCVVKLVSC